MSDLFHVRSLWEFVCLYEIPMLICEVITVGRRVVLAFQKVVRGHGCGN